MRVERVPRTPGGRLPASASETAPLALRANVEFNHVLHERVVIVSVVSENVPHVP
jgi:KUP system potassium uptake protein